MTVTCKDLAQMVTAVTAGQNDRETEDAVERIHDSDMMVIEWLCRLVPPGTLAYLHVLDGKPLWGVGALTQADLPGTLSIEVLAAQR